MDSVQPSKKVRARDLGVPFEGTPGPLNAITDVKGVAVGHKTLISGEGDLQIGKGPIRTGVTAIRPRIKNYYDPVAAGWYCLNGNGELTGTTWVEESGYLEGPIVLTNTFSVGIAHASTIAWMQKKLLADPTAPDKPVYVMGMPMSGETCDGTLNDIGGFHVKEEHVFSALNSAKTGVVAEGNVGGGTGMICHDFKGGIGTSSRKVMIENNEYTVGILVQANYGVRDTLLIGGMPVGLEITDLQPIVNERGHVSGSSIIVVVATDTPLISHQLKRLARRVPMGIARVGGTARHGSGDIFIAFSTANDGAGLINRKGIIELEMIPNNQMNPLFRAVIQATEEAIINALVAAETMVGINGNTAYAIPHDRLEMVLKKYNRLAK
jgi:L-aminopeptidase/D-esterase-like protein